MSRYRNIDYALDAGVATITLSRPEKLNALTPALLGEVAAAARQAQVDGARALVLTGAGRAFCSGADLAPDDQGYEGLPEDLGALLDAHYHPVVLALSALDIPIVTAVNGLAAGAGASLALLGDIVVMARSAYLLLAFANIGLVPDAGATWLVAKSAGRAKALEMALLGERMSADDAAAAGLVARVVDDGAALAEATAIAGTLARGPTLALGMIRRQVAAALTATLEQTLTIEAGNQARAGRSDDFKEALAAFGEKRKPQFKGR